MEVTGERRDRVVVGMTGRHGLSYGIRLLEALDSRGIEIHLVLSGNARAALGDELATIRPLAAQIHPQANQAARISSGSFLTLGMIVLPCSPHSAAAIGLGLARNLVQRAADVTLKEQRPLVLGVPDPAYRTLELAVLARLSSVPGLEVVSLDADPDGAVSAALAQLGIERERERA